MSYLLRLANIRHEACKQRLRQARIPCGVVKLTFRLAQLLAGMPYSPYEDATTNQLV